MMMKFAGIIALGLVAATVAQDSLQDADEEFGPQARVVRANHAMGNDTMSNTTMSNTTAGEAGTTEGSGDSSGGEEKKAGTATVSLVITLDIDVAKLDDADLKLAKDQVAAAFAKAGNFDVADVASITFTQDGKTKRRAANSPITVTLTFYASATVVLADITTAVKAAVAADGGFTVTVTLSTGAVTSSPITAADLTVDDGTQTTTNGAAHVVGSLAGAAMLAWCM